MKPLKIGLIGCGAIGSYLASAIDNQPENWLLCGIIDLTLSQAEKLRNKLKSVPIISDLEELIKEADIVVEAAGVNAVLPIIQLAEKHRKKVVVISVGALLLFPEILDIINKGELEVSLPSGALAGLDALKAASKEHIESVQLFTRKPLKSIAGAPYFKEQGIDILKISSPTIIFQGNAFEAVKAFPKNINVAATVSFAGIGPEKTEIVIEVSPAYTANSHELIVQGAFGSFKARTENLPFPQNPKTSFLAALSTLRTLSGFMNNLKIGS